MTKRPEPNRRQVLGAGLALGATGVFGLSGCAGREAAPDSTFVLLDGSQARTADLQGKVTLVNFWATTCVTCVKEMPALVATHQKYASRGYETMAVAMSYDPPAWVVNFVQSRQLPFKVALDNTGEIAKAWGDVKLTPTTYLLDKQGRIVKRYVGEPEMDALHKLIEELLAA
ncbi:MULTISPECIES: TlpA disulfide reductase family protein [unclassified Hydrogenophaga]|uniref:TlpA family protein disulfide reductase n=1 Tax=unclassified Hydrogenophaga TaxID=2610897 RepID=UPI00095C5B1D|nr:MULTISPECIES: TlpA disulfide reductase family protein [unclassified Hydrogenophaga]OJV37550.1 MAG: redoxin [Hydrogenophaga sp. 70-12]